MKSRAKKGAGKLLVSKVTKLRQNFDLILLRLINKIASSKLTVKLKSLKPECMILEVITQKIERFLGDSTGQSTEAKKIE